MLRVTEIHRDKFQATFKLEGKLVQPWVDEVHGMFADQPLNNLRFDLSHLTYVDDPGTELLRQYLGQGVQIVSCTPYVAELLHLERNPSPNRARP